MTNNKKYNSDNLDTDTILKYLSNDLSEELKHDVEKKSLENDFEKDAIEGLALVQNKRKITKSVNKLNYKLYQKLNLRGKLWQKTQFKEIGFITVVILIVLLLVILGYVVIHLHSAK